MNKIICIYGETDSFFLNEIDYVTRHFDETLVLCYPTDDTTIAKAALDKKYKYQIVKPNVLSVFANPYFYQVLLRKTTMEEIAKILCSSKRRIASFAHLLYYVAFYITAKKYIDQEISTHNQSNVVLYSFWLSRGAYVLANYGSKRSPKIKKIVCRAHGYDLYEDRNKNAFLPFRDFTFRNLDQISFISEHGKKYFIKKFEKRFRNLKLDVSRLGTFRASVMKRIVPKNRVVIASCSSIIPLKRLDLIIDILSNVSCPTKWIHIGVGKEMKKIEEYAAQKLEKGSYEFLGRIDNSEVLKTYEKNDVDYFMNMSDYEGIPVSIMEAMSMGIPVIARDVGGVAEIVSSHSGLLLSDVSNKDEVYYLVNNELRRRIDSSTSYEAKVRKNLSLWEEKYNAERNYDTFFRTLSESL